MKICIIGKLPPIQGGVSKLNFWIVEALALGGHEVHVVTNGAEVETQYRTVGARLDRKRADSPLAGLENVTLHYTNERAHYAYIPFANPFVSKLSSMAIDVIRRHGCDLVFGHYFEPYGVAAYIAAQATGVPYGLQHAGSDVSRLLQSPELRPIYREMMCNADFIFAGSSTTRRFIHEGVAPEKLFSLPPSTYADELYTPDCEPLDLAGYLDQAREELRDKPPLGLLDEFPGSNYRPDRPTIGVYGKTGDQKGSFDLIAALARLKQEGFDFNFLALTNSSKTGATEFHRRAREAGLRDRMVWLPFMPFWDVPRFVRRCDAVCFLERDFQIPIHRPAVAIEVMLCAACLIVSGEIASKQRFGPALRNGENAVIVDPKDTDALVDAIRSTLSDRARAADIGRAGRALIVEHTVNLETIAAALNRRFEEVHEEVQSRKQEAAMIEFQSYLNRLYTDDVFRKLHNADVQASQSFFKLSDEEKRLLKGIEMRAIEQFADGLKIKSRQRHASFLPLTCKAVGDERVNRYFDRYHSLNRMTPGETKIALVSRFGQFLEDSILAEFPSDSWLPELARFERTLMELSLRTTDADDFRHINKPAPAAAQIGDDDIVFVRDCVQIDSFSHDIPAIMKSLKSDAAAQDHAPRRTDVVFVVLPAEAQPKVLKANAASVALLHLARERGSFAGLVRRFSESRGAPVAPKDVRDVVAFFLRAGVLGVEPAMATAAA